MVLIRDKIVCQAHVLVKRSFIGSSAVYRIRCDRLCGYVFRVLTLFHFCGWMSVGHWYPDHRRRIGSPGARVPGPIRCLTVIEGQQDLHREF